MPMYEYWCSICRGETERLERYERDSPPECCGIAMRKLMSTQLHVLKGTGFYATEWGLKAHHLEPGDQARRAAREVKERKLRQAVPGPVTTKERKELDTLSRRYG